METYRGAIDRILANPFTGVGLDSESATIGTSEPHNLIIGIWFRAGFLGLTGIILVLLAIFSVARRTLREARSVDEQLLALALLCSFVAFVVFSMAAPILHPRYGWAPAALLLALRAMQIRRAAPSPLGVHTPRPGLARSPVRTIAQPR